jgi:PIN domain nuclease of toxin-antitoxin system
MHSLIDTHVMIWWVTSDMRLSDKAMGLISNDAQFQPYEVDVFW